MTEDYYRAWIAAALARAEAALADGDYDRARTEARTAEQHAGLAWQERQDRLYREQEGRRRERAGAA